MAQDDLFKLIEDSVEEQKGAMRETRAAEFRAIREQMEEDDENGDSKELCSRYEKEYLKLGDNEARIVGDLLRSKDFKRLRRYLLLRGVTDGAGEATCSMLATASLNDTEAAVYMAAVMGGRYIRLIGVTDDWENDMSSVVYEFQMPGTTKWITSCLHFSHSDKSYASYEHKDKYCVWCVFHEVVCRVDETRRFLGTGHIPMFEAKR